MKLTSLILIGLILICLQNSNAQSVLPVEYQALSREIFKELIEINTIPEKGCTKAVLAMAVRLKNAGFKDQDMVIAGPHPDHKNLVIRYQGKDHSHAILFICHLDVVQALLSDWSTDPFTFTEKDGYFYGRGTTDIKSEDADLIVNLIRLKKENFFPSCDIIVALTDDEEGGDYNGVDWLLVNRPELIKADYAINPDGGGGDLKNGIPFLQAVQTSEKIYISYDLETRNKGGHSSIPVKDNAIYELSAALTNLSNYQFPLNLNETTQFFFQSMAETENGQTKIDMLALAQNPDDTLAANRLASSRPYYNAMMRTTCVATLISGGHAENALPQSAHATINCRMLPDEKPADVFVALTRVVDDSLIRIIPINEPFVAPLSPLNKQVMVSMKKTTDSMWPRVIITPVMMTGASDGRFLRKAGIPVYGISGMFGDPDDVRAHGMDERINARSFYEGVEFMYRFIRNLTE
ncbi:MAG TPA: M20/M25/M40 family metallo-hydrolase [Bacteroidales bacterium]|nr:M20/M25/M40 family metallo-hydrolase [Bacteroidales bacterium]